MRRERGQHIPLVVSSTIVYRLGLISSQCLYCYSRSQIFVFTPCIIAVEYRLALVDVGIAVSKMGSIIAENYEELFEDIHMGDHESGSPET